MDAGELNVLDQLGLMNALELIYAFQFHDQFIFDQQIDVVATVQINTFVFYG